MHIILIALVIAATPSLALAQSWTATTGTTQPTTKAPDTLPNGQPRAMIPPAARSGEKGLRYGEGALDAGPVQVKRLK